MKGMKLRCAKKWIGKVGSKVKTEPTRNPRWLRNKKGFVGLIIGVLMGFMVVTMLITLLPGFTEMIDYGKSSQALNCVGYVDSNLADGNHSYNITIGTKSSVACLALSLYLPYIVLAILVGMILKILYDRGQGTQQNYYG